MVVHVVAAFALMPVAGHPYDLASLTGTSGAWLRWGVPLFYQWKFGFDLSVLAIGSQGLSYVLGHLGMSGAAALAAAWKLPLVLADLLVGAVLLDLGRQLRCQRPALMPTLWLISPVSLWVSAGHGQIESLTIAAVAASLDLLLRRRPLLAGVVMGLGIGIEYLPVLVAPVVIFWLCVRVIERREAYRFVAGCAGALAFCFGPPLATDVGRTSLLGGLSFSADVASHPGHTQGAGHVGSSLWAVLELSPGPFWLAVALSAAVAFMIMLARKARSTDPRRLGILAAGGLLLCVTLFDPGTLPQFSVIVLGGLCIAGLCVDLSPAVIILGPFLQLAPGLLFVYGGNFQSFWYDMWATTGVSGWPFPQSLQAADWAARLGAVVVALGLLLASSRALGAKIPARRRMVAARWPIAAGALGTAFLATWSMQPAFWQGVGSRGPATLADFPIITASQPGKVSVTPGHALITFSPLEVLAARASTVAPSLALTVTARPFFAQTTANTTRYGHGIVQALTVPGWARDRTQVRSLWISALFGRSAWRTQSKVLGGVPALAVRDRPVYPSEATWVAPGWAVVTYDIPAAMVSHRGRLTLRLLKSPNNGDVIGWNGSPHVRWVLVSLHSGTAAATIDDIRWHGLVTLPSPTPSWWYQRTEQASVQVAEKSISSVDITRVAIGGQQAAITGGGFAWPSPGALDHTIHGPLLSVLGVIDVVALLGGALVLGRRAAGARRPRVRFPGQSRGRHRAGRRPKSVVMTTRYPLDHPGGVESVARALVDRLGGSADRLGGSADRLRGSAEGWRVSHVAAYGGRAGAARIPLFGDLVAAGRLAARIIGKGDVLLVHGAEYSWGPLAVGRLTGRPVVVVWHGVRASESLRPAKRRVGEAARQFFLRSESLLQRAALHADATVAVSPTVAMELRSRYGVRGEIKVIPNGVAMRTPRLIGHPRDDARGPASSNGLPLRVIWVGTSAYNKRLDLAVEACTIARARGQDISLTVVGIPVQSAGLDPASAGSWLTGLGAVPPREMEALYRRHDILLFPTRYEAFGLVALEAMAAGLPVIGSNAVRWLIEGGGVVVAGDDAEAYAHALRALAEPELLRQLSGAALERARAFSWESSAAGYLEVLDGVDKRGRHRYSHQSRKLAPSPSGAE